MSLFQHAKPSQAPELDLSIFSDLELLRLKGLRDAGRLGVLGFSYHQGARLLFERWYWGHRTLIERADDGAPLPDGMLARLY